MALLLRIDWIIRHRHSWCAHRLRVSVDLWLSTTKYAFFDCFSFHS